VGGYVRANNGRKEIHLNDKSKVILNPKDVTIGEVKRYSSERKKLSEISETDSSVEVLATIVQVFDPRFFEVCPECRKRARPRDDYHYCEEHGKVKPTYSYVMNVLLDDGTDTTRTIFFGNQMERLLGKTKEQLLELKENLPAFEELKLDLLGKTIKVIGRVKKNEMFDRLEINSNLVFMDIDPAEEIKKFATRKQENKPTESLENSNNHNQSTPSKESEKTTPGEETTQTVSEEVVESSEDTKPVDIQDIAFNKN